MLLRHLLLLFTTLLVASAPTLVGQTTEDYFQRAASAFHQGYYHQALRDFERVTLARPKSAKGHFGVAMCQIRIGKDDEALGNFQRAVATDNADAQVFLHFGIALEKNSQPEKALLQLERALKAAPKNHETSLFLGLTQVRLGKLVAARANFERSRKLAPRDARPAEEIASLDLRDRKLERAGAILRSILKEDPARVRSLYLLSRILARQGEREAAKEIAVRWRQAEKAEQARTIRALRASAQLGLAYAALSEKSWKRAFDYLRSALDTEPKHCESRHALAGLEATLQGVKDQADLLQKVRELQQRLKSRP